MTGRGWRQKVVALGALAGAAVLPVVAAQPAGADSRTFVAAFGCVSGVDPAWWGVRINLGSGWTNVSVDAVRAAPGTEQHELTIAVPSTASSVSLDAVCFVDYTESMKGIVMSEVGTWTGWTYSLVPGTSTVRSTYLCERHTAFPGPFVRACARTAVSYG